MTAAYDGSAAAVKVLLKHKACIEAKSKVVM